MLAGSASKVEVMSSFSQNHLISAPEHLMWRGLYQVIPCTETRILVANNIEMMIPTALMVAKGKNPHFTQPGECSLPFFCGSHQFCWLGLCRTNQIQNLPGFCGPMKFFYKFVKSPYRTHNNLQWLIKLRFSYVLVTDGFLNLVRQTRMCL